MVVKIGSIVDLPRAHFNLVPVTASKWIHSVLRFVGGLSI